MEGEKIMRRKIANSNERRRMESINAGFELLRGLLPLQDENEKLSKSAVLRQSADYIYQLEQEKSQLLSQNTQLKSLMYERENVASIGKKTPARKLKNGNANPSSSSHSEAEPEKVTMAKRRKILDGAVESADEGIGSIGGIGSTSSLSPKHNGSENESQSELMELRREINGLQIQLRQERQHKLDIAEHYGKRIAQLQQEHVLAPKYEHVETVQAAVEEVEVETSNTIPTPPTGSPGKIILDQTPRCYTIRNNLETIVEAIRHLEEGDRLFSEEKGAKPSPSLTSETSSPMEMEVYQTQECCQSLSMKM